MKGSPSYFLFNRLTSPDELLTRKPTTLNACKKIWFAVQHITAVPETGRFPLHPRILLLALQFWDMVQVLSTIEITLIESLPIGSPCSSKQTCAWCSEYGIWKIGKCIMHMISFCVRIESKSMLKQKNLEWLAKIQSSRTYLVGLVALLHLSYRMF